MRYAIVSDIHANLEGNVEEAFFNYTPAANRKFMEEAIAALGDGFNGLVTSRGSTKEAFIERLAGYSETTRCTGLKR